MNEPYQIYLVSDSMGETIDRIFIALRSQFTKFKYKVRHYSFTRTENQINQIIKDASKHSKPMILFTLVDENLNKLITNSSKKNNIPCYGVLGDLIEKFSKDLNQKSLSIPSRQHKLNDEYYDRVEAIQFTMNHDDGKDLKDVEESDIIILGVSRTSKTPTSIYLANRGYKTSNIPLINENSVPKSIKNNKKLCIVGLTTDPERLIDLRKNRLRSLKESEKKQLYKLEKNNRGSETGKKTFKKYNWPVIDVTRKSVEETQHL